MRRTAALAIALASLLALPAGPALAARSAPLAPLRGLDAGTATQPAAAAPELDTANRWIVVLKPDAGVASAEIRARGYGAHPDLTFSKAIHGYSAKLDARQLDQVRRDPGVAMVVADEVVSAQGQTVPSGVRRVSGTYSPIAKIDGTDGRVDADVAIVDTGIDRTHPDLNVVGGVNCSTSDRAAWSDDNGHGTHVAGAVGALDNGFGVVGVAPGVRLWAVRILNSAGNGLLSWYVCGLDWIAAARDPVDPTRPLFEAVNMSVAKPGSDDHACGAANADILHAAICRLVASGVTVVAAAGNNSFNASRLVPASYDEVITVSALADTDGRPGGLGGNACLSWGGYDKDDTFADFSNFGADVDLIAPGKCILSTLPHNSYGLLSGTSMAAPLVTGAVALYKSSRPLAPPSEVKAALQAMGNLNWNVATDPDPYHEPLLDVSKIVPLGDYALAARDPAALAPGTGATVMVPLSVNRAEDFGGEVDLTLDPASQLGAAVDRAVVKGLGSTVSTLTVTVPTDTPTGIYRLTVLGTSGDRVRSVTISVAVAVDGDVPTMPMPRLGLVTGSRFETRSFRANGLWNAATDPTSPIIRYQAQWRVDGGPWGGTIGLSAATEYTPRTFLVGHTYRLRVRASDSAGNWSAWSEARPFTAQVIQDSSATLRRTGTWRRYVSSAMSAGTTRYARARGASIARTFTGRAVSVIAPMGPTRGRAQVWLDGALVYTMNTWSRTSAPRRVMYTRTWTASDNHTIRVVVLGTAGHPRFDLDAFVVIR